MTNEGATKEPQTIKRETCSKVVALCYFAIQYCLDAESTSTSSAHGWSSGTFDMSMLMRLLGIPSGMPSGYSASSGMAGLRMKSEPPGM